MEEHKNQPQTANAKFGTWTFVIAALVLAIVLLLNLLMSVLPTNLTMFDITSQNLYTLTDTTKDLVKNLKTDISVTVICETGEEDTLLRDTLSRYDELSDRLSVNYVDPMLDPTVVSRLTDGEYDSLLTSENATDNNSLILRSEKRYCIIRHDDLGYIEYSPDDLYAAMMTGEEPEGTTYYNAENQITAGIDFVAADHIPVYYVLTGHAESELPQNLQNEISLSNIQLKSLDLITKGEIPTDAQGLVICNPSRDYTTTELATIRAFLQAGGDMMLLTRQSNLEHLPQLLALLAEYGVSAKNDTVLTDNSSYHAYGESEYVLYFSDATTEQVYLEQGAVRVPYAHPIEIAQTLPQGVTVKPLLQIADGAYLENEGKTGEEKTYPLVVSVEAQTQNGTAKIMWLSSDRMVTDERYNLSGNNQRYFLNLMSDLAEKDTTISIAAIKLDSGKIIVSQTQGIVWGVILVGVVPATFATVGLIYYRKRRKH